MNKLYNAVNLYHTNFKSPEGSAPYEILKFPDGEVQIRFLEDSLQKLLDFPGQLQIIAPVRSSDELFILLQVLNLTMSKDRHITIPYLMSARNDRNFGDGRAVNTLIVDKMLSVYLGYGDQLVLVDPHNNNTGNQIILDAKIGMIYYKPFPAELKKEPRFTIFPDEGAYYRYYRTIEFGRYAVAEKERDLKTGWINKYNIDLENLLPDDKIVIVDDLVDGGSTFRMLAEELKDIPNEKILVVTHFIQPNALLALTNYYDMIYVTNSYGSELTHPKIKVEDVRK